MRFGRMSRLAAVSCLAICCGAAAGQESLRDRFVMAGEEAIGLLPPELVCGPSVTEAKWSPDGRYVLALCREERVSPALARTRALAHDPKEPPGDLTLVVWSRDLHRSREVWRRTLTGSNVEEFRWLPGSDRAVAIVSETVPSAAGPRTRREILWMRAESDSARMVVEIPFDEHPPGWVGSPNSHHIYISPKQPIAMIVGVAITKRKLPLTDGRVRTMLSSQYDLTPIRDDGTPAPVVHLPQDVDPFTWSESGSTYYLQHLEWSRDPKQKPARTWFEFDPRSGQTQRLDAEPPNVDALLESGHLKQEPEHGPVRLASTSSEVKEGNTAARLRPLWLETTGERQTQRPNSLPARDPIRRALVCPDAASSQLSPTGDAVLYVTHCAAWVRPLLRASMRDYAAMLKEEERRQAVADASKLAQALQELVQDRESLPTVSQVREWLAPYVKDSPGLIDRMTYTFDGGARPGKPEEWASLRLGSVAGPGGRAYIYADGHAAWKDE